MERISSNYILAIDSLVQRFKEKHDPQNDAHKELKVRVNDLVEQLRAVEFIRKNPPQSGDHGLDVQRAAARLKFLADEAAKAFTMKAKEYELSFERSLREHSGLANGPYAVEIRERLYGMKPAERVKAVQGMITNKDGSALAAIFDAPPLLTGLSPEDIPKFREQFFQSTVPDIVKARDVYRELSEHAHAAIRTALKAATDYSDPRRLRELELKEAAAETHAAKLKEA